MDWDATRLCRIPPALDTTGSWNSEPLCWDYRDHSCAPATAPAPRIPCRTPPLYWEEWDDRVSPAVLFHALRISVHVHSSLRISHPGIRSHRVLISGSCPSLSSPSQRCARSESFPACDSLYPSCCSAETHSSRDDRTPV